HVPLASATDSLPISPFGALAAIANDRAMLMVREWHVGGVSVVAMCERKRSGCGKASLGEDVVDSHVLPSGVELRPRGHAVDVSCHPGSWERVELRPAPRFDRTRSDLQRESPVRGIDPRRGSGRKHWEIIDEVLSRGNPVR